MDILIRYFDHEENRVKVRYLDSKIFGHATHQDLFIQFMQALFKLDTKKMLPSVNGWTNCQPQISGKTSVRLFRE